MLMFGVGKEREREGGRGADDYREVADGYKG